MRSSSELGLVHDILNDVPVGVIRQGADGVIVYSNRVATKIFGMPEDDIAGRTSTDPLWQMVREDGTPVPGIEHPSMVTLTTGEPVRNAIRGLFAGDPSRMRWLVISTEPVRNGVGAITEVVISFQDITKLRKAEDEAKRLLAQLLRAQKMEAVGRLAGGIAHDFNNLLTSVTGNLEVLRDRSNGDEISGTAIDDALEATRRAAELTRQLLAFSRTQPLEFRLVDVSVLLGDIGKMLARLIGDDILLELDMDTDIGWIRADPGQIEQVIVNLVVNARDAMSEGGRITIRGEQRSVPQATSPHAESPGPGDYVVLTIQDTGAGLSAEAQQRIFEPFYTARPSGPSSGLGLATVFGAIAQHGGTITVDSEQDQGATFTIHLPRSEAPEAPPSVPPILSDVQGGTETILVVDDEDLVRRIVARIISRLGYRVLTASDGAEALAVSRATPGPIELLLTDIVMPGMSGYAVAEILQEERPGIAVVLSSGYAEEDVSHFPGVHEGRVHFLAKPYRTHHLADVLRKALATTARQNES